MTQNKCPGTGGTVHGAEASTDSIDCRLLNPNATPRQFENVVLPDHPQARGNRRLTIEEHRAVAAALYVIRDHFDSNILNKFKNGSWTHARILRVIRKINLLRNELDSLLFQQQAENAITALAKIYYGGPPPVADKHDIDANGEASLRRTATPTTLAHCITSPTKPTRRGAFVT